MLSPRLRPTMQWTARWNQHSKIQKFKNPMGQTPAVDSIRQCLVTSSSVLNPPSNNPPSPDDGQSILFLLLTSLFLQPPPPAEAPEPGEPQTTLRYTLNERQLGSLSFKPSHKCKERSKYVCYADMTRTFKKTRDGDNQFWILSHEPSSDPLHDNALIGD